MVKYKNCNVQLNFRLSLKDAEDNKTKKLYICPNCSKYYFMDSEE